MAGVYRFHGGWGAICSGAGWARGRLLAGIGCRGLTVGGSAAVSPWCVPWWSLVGWLKGAFGVYRIHWGTILCWCATAGGALGCGGGACVGVIGVVGGGVSRVVLSAPHGGLLWWCLGGGLGLRGSWEGAGHAGSGGLGGGGTRVGLRVYLLLSPRYLPLPSLAPLFSLACFALFFFSLGGGSLGRCALVWVCAGAGAGVGVGVVGDGGRVAVALWVPCVCAGPQASGFQGAGPGGADGGWSAAVVAWRLRGLSRWVGLGHCGRCNGWRRCW